MTKLDNDKSLTCEVLVRPSVTAHPVAYIITVTATGCHYRQKGKRYSFFCPHGAALDCAAKIAAWGTETTES